MANVTQGPQGSAANSQKWIDNGDGSYSQQVTAALGDVAHDAVDSGNPMKIGGHATTSAPAAVSDGDRVNAYFDEVGRLHVVVDTTTGVVTIADGGGTISVDDGGSTVSIDDGAGSITVDGSVTISSVPASARTTDNIGAAMMTDAIMNSTTALTPKFASVSRATNADGAAVVAKVTSKKIRVLSVALVFAGASGVKWQSATTDTTGTGVDTDLSAVMSFAANGGYVLPFNPTGWFETASGEGLKLNSNSTNQVSGHLSYIEV